MNDGRFLAEEHIWMALGMCPVCNELADGRARRKKDGRWTWVYRHTCPQKYCRSIVEVDAPKRRKAK